MEPIKGSKNWKVGIVWRWISDIANKSVDPIPIGSKPGSGSTKMPPFKESNDGGSLNKVTIVFGRSSSAASAKTETRAIPNTHGNDGHCNNRSQSPRWDCLFCT